MICKCNTEMNYLIEHIGSMENSIGYYSNCPKCGRIYYYDESRRNYDSTYKDKSYWIEPEYLNEKIN